jgi:hypothetical protein
VPANAIVKGNPGRITGYVDSSQIDVAQNFSSIEGDVSNPLIDVKGVEIITLKTFSDIRGNIAIANIK